ncbi:MAG: hypothetical protein HY716_18830 [Planctomycetes bacterium]|nr:hypothetical protein [Planctomycetota bacterium]
MAKHITGSVGQGGLNHPSDVMTVQYLLNCVPATQGGPSPELAVDGIVGPKTINAIHRFQKASFNWSDGRVDAGGKSLKALQAFDPYPQFPLAAGAAKSAPGKWGAGPSGKAAGGKTSTDPWGKIGAGKTPGAPAGGKSWF